MRNDMAGEQERADGLPRSEKAPDSTWKAAPNFDKVASADSGSCRLRSLTTIYRRRRRGDLAQPASRMSYFLPHLPTGWHVDQAILSEEDRVVIIRFGHDTDPVCMEMDETLYKISTAVQKFAVIYLVDTTQVPDFNKMYELYDACSVMFFYRNKHIMIDLGTGNNNKINWAITERQELIDIVEVVYRGASKGRGLVISPKGRFESHHTHERNCNTKADNHVAAMEQTTRRDNNTRSSTQAQVQEHWLGLDHVYPPSSHFQARTSERVSASRLLRKIGRVECVKLPSCLDPAGSSSAHLRRSVWA
ncbi:hypothetical protein L1887_49091 [Cichorium endivia]|nr:hypothetical protein L1887_49091 [Cichorium endivia]